MVHIPCYFVHLSDYEHQGFHICESVLLVEFPVVMAGERKTNMGANSFEEHEKRRKSSRLLGSAKKKKKFVEFMSMRLKYFVPKSIRSPKDVGIVTPVPVGRRIHN
jgi:hypothetical protein